MKKILIQSVAILLLGASASLVVAAEKPRYGIGGRAQFSNWSGDNNGNSADYDADATMLAFSFRYQQGLLYAGASLQGGEYSFTGGSPDRNNTTSPTTQSDARIKRGELDLIVGYYFWPKISLFMDIKGVTSTWKEDDYIEDHAGLGLGISGFTPLPNNWTLYGSFGFVPLKIETKGKSIGDGNGSSLEIGVSNKINDHHSVSFGLKSQTQQYNYDNGNKQTHKIGGLVAGYNYMF